jgi:hypothetical protein
LGVDPSHGEAVGDDPVGVLAVAAAVAGSRCWSCELAALVDQLLTNPDTGVMAAEVVPVAAALKSMKRSNSGVTWIRQRHVTAFLKDLAGATSALARVSGDDHRDVVRRFIRWQLQRRMNRMETVPHGTFLRSKQTVTVTIEFLNWLNDRGITLAELQHSPRATGRPPSWSSSSVSTSKTSSS